MMQILRVGQRIKFSKITLSLLSLTFILLLFSPQTYAQNAPKQPKAAREKISKWEKKARKQEAKADRIKKKMVKLQKKAKKPSPLKISQFQKKVDVKRAKAEGFRYKGKSIRHIKAQTKKGKKAMKKSLKKHRKYKRSR